MNFENQEKKENPPNEITLWQSKEIEIVRPNPCAIPEEEGLHLEAKAEKETEAHWQEKDTKKLLEMGLYSLPVAKVIAEGKFTPDFWSNIQFNARPGFEKAINIYGRSPESDASWAKPVRMREIEYSSQEELLPNDIKNGLEKTFALYLRLWENIKKNINLFRAGVGEIKEGSEEYSEEKKSYLEKEDPYKEDLLWANEKFALVSVKNPHLTGYHLVVHPRDKYWKDKGGFKMAWQTEKSEEENPEYMEGFLEALSILLGAERILFEEKSFNCNNPEIHFSGNWAKGLQPIEKGGKLSLEYLKEQRLEKARKKEKISHRVGAEEEFQAAFHGHLYATFNPEEYVNLPSRPLAEAPEEWEGIKGLDSATVEKIKDLTQKKLTPWLEKECQGAL